MVHKESASTAPLEYEHSIPVSWHCAASTMNLLCRLDLPGNTEINSYPWRSPKLQLILKSPSPHKTGTFADCKWHFDAQVFRRFDVYSGRGSWLTKWNTINSNECRESSKKMSNLPQISSVLSYTGFAGAGQWRRFMTCSIFWRYK